ncbi:MAG: carbonic anhydrase [Desulfuromonadaceae bacterium]|nr:carbonic anhydrase [Desulfuromonadaceae bacterium]
MKLGKLFAIKGIAVVGLLLSVSMSWAVYPHTTLTADQALAQLQMGNAQFVKGRDLHLAAQIQPAVRISAGTIGQGPSSVVLGCIDSRVPPEIIFDRGLNEMFSVRVAGNVIAPHEIGSIEYAVEHVEVPLIVVLGHTKCGAVTSSVQYAWPFLSYQQQVPLAPVPNPPGVPATVEVNFVNSLVNSLLPAINASYVQGMTQSQLIDAAIHENVVEVAKQLREQSAIIDELVLAGKVKIVAGEYDVVTGVVTWIPLP